MTKVISIPRHPAGVHLPGVVTRTGWDLPEDISRDDWLACGRVLDDVEGSVQWWRGDWWAYGAKRKYGDGAELAERAGVDYQTIRTYGAVARAYELSTRVDNVSFFHHRAAMAAEPEERHSWLKLAASEGWSVAELRRQIREATNRHLISPVITGSFCGFDQLRDLIAKGIQFGNIYADPPWIYDNQGTRAATGNHYEGMTVDQLCDPSLLPIAALAAPDAHLHLWTTNAFLFECPRILEAWGFEFKSSFVWVKTEMGIGNYWRNAHEFLLTGVRGNAKRFDQHNLRSWLECSRGGHSDKPDQVREMIAKASPTPRLELFARRGHNGWLSWGDQIETSLFSSGAQQLASIAS